MFLKKSTTTIRGKTYDNYKIVESYREGEKGARVLPSLRRHVAEYKNCGQTTRTVTGGNQKWSF
ncbi:MAG: hypothetical protein M1598_05835 [Actinobacteria bacterium]|nr:hypothetical protein [Bacillota bacterium]MCL5046293.1 hypothetical protein [Actinomycetota bacterium]